MPPIASGQKKVFRGQRPPFKDGIPGLKFSMRPIFTLRQLPLPDLARWPALGPYSILPRYEGTQGTL